MSETLERALGYVFASNETAFKCVKKATALKPTIFRTRNYTSYGYEAMPNQIKNFFLKSWEEKKEKEK